MLAPSDVPSILGRYFDLAEYISFRASLLVFFLLGLRRLIEREWKRK